MSLAVVLERVMVELVVEATVEAWLEQALQQRWVRCCRYQSDRRKIEIEYDSRRRLNHITAQAQATKLHANLVESRGKTRGGHDHSLVGCLKPACTPV